MRVYIETSAVVAWLLDQEAGWLAYKTVRNADVVISSDLTVVECERALRRRVASGEVSAERATVLRVEFYATASAWSLVGIGPEIVSRASESFPVDLIRSMDAIHLATAVRVRASVGELAIVSLDDRVRSNGQQLGFQVLPS